MSDPISVFPVYAQGHDDTDDTPYSWERDLPSFRGDETPTVERVARAHAHARRRRCEEQVGHQVAVGLVPCASVLTAYTVQVRERDEYRCFMTGVYDSRWCHRRPFPDDAKFLCCSTVPIIPPEVWAHEVSARTM